MRNWKRFLCMVCSVAMLFTMMPVLRTQSSAAEAWLWPLAGCQIVLSNFGYRDLDGDGELDWSDPHRGIDIIRTPQDSTKGMPIRATKSGTIITSIGSCPHVDYKGNCGCNGGAGNYIVIQHTDGTHSRYLHMLQEGLHGEGYVSQGETIGYVGTSGWSYGYHLHFEMLDSSWNLMNPMPTNSEITIWNEYSIPSGWPSEKTTYVFEAGSSQNPSDDSMSIYGYNYPSSLDVGDTFSIYGTVSSGYSNISSLTVGVYNSSGSMETGKTVYPNARTYNIANVDEYVLFNILSAGTYYYRITATNASGTKELLNRQFSVIGTPVVGVDKMIDCYRKVTLPARTINLYWNPTDTSPVTYFDYGPTVSCPTYAEMTDGSVMYKAKVNHQGVNTEMWFKLESDMSVSISHTYSSTQHEYAHPHAEYKTCACGQLTYTGYYGERDDCCDCYPPTITSSSASIELDMSNKLSETITLTLGGAPVYDYSIQVSCPSFVSWSLGSKSGKSLPLTITANGIGSGTIKVKLTAAETGDVYSEISIAVYVTDTDFVTDSGTCGDNLTWSYYEAKKTLEISGTGAMSDYTCSMGYCSSPWAAYARDITTLILPEGLTYIGDWAFYTLATANSPSSISISIPNSVQSVSGTAFTEAAVESYYVASDSQYLDAVDGVLYSKDHKVLISYPDRKEDTSYAVLPDAERIGNSAFLYNNCLKSITLPASIREIGREAFSDTSITAISIPEGVTVLEKDVFHQCGYLTEVELPSTIKQISKGAFTGCRSLTSVMIPNSVTIIGDWAFFNCSSLTSVTIPDSVTSIGYEAFRACSSLTSVYFEGNAPEIEEHVFQMQDEGTWEYVNIPNLTLYYIEGKEGWTTPTWNGYPTATWELPHEHTYTDTVTAPTCTEKGYTTHTCECGDSFKDTYVDALGHDYKDGVCTRCGEKDPNAAPPVAYTDVSEKAWYYDAVQYATKNGLMNGVGGNKFDPNGGMTRAMLVTVLWRYAGQPMGYKNKFTDVNAKSGSWYIDAVAWAAENGIVNGIGSNKFDPNGKITREQMAAILFRYASQNGIDTSKRGDLNSFPDASKVSPWAKDAAQWTVAEGIINGSDGKLLPKGDATRAQVSAILMRFIENIVKK